MRLPRQMMTIKTDDKTVRTTKIIIGTFPPNVVYKDIGSVIIIANMRI